MSHYRFSPSFGWFTHVWKSATRQDHLHLRPVLRRILPPHGVAIDVGAHGGQVTRLLASLVPEGKVIAIEPGAYSRSILRLALWSRGLSNVEVIAGALGAEQTTAILQTPIKRRGDMGYGLAHITRSGQTAEAATPSVVRELVLVTTLDALIVELALPRIDFIKADIEGYEAAFVAGAMKTLRQHHPAVFLEHDSNRLTRAGADNPQLWTTLTSLDYKPHTIEVGKLDAVPVELWPIEGDIVWLHEKTENLKTQS